MRTRELCPRCGGPALVDWDGTTAPGRRTRQPMVVAALQLSCPNACRLDPDQLHTSFPDRYDVHR